MRLTISGWTSEKLGVLLSAILDAMTQVRLSPDLAMEASSESAQPLPLATFDRIKASCIREYENMEQRTTLDQAALANLFLRDREAFLPDQKLEYLRCASFG